MDDLERRLSFDGGLLRPLRESDAAAIARHANDAEIARQLRDQFPFPYGRNDAITFIRSLADQSIASVFAIEVDGEAIGSIGLFVQADINRCSAELGYWLGRAYWNRGIATAAISRVVEWGFRELELVRVFAVPFARNRASCRVLEKAGFECEGVMRRAAIKHGEIIDQVLYARCA